jgi:hypothetical protein
MALPESAIWALSIIKRFTVKADYAVGYFGHDVGGCAANAPDGWLKVGASGGYCSGKDVAVFFPDLVRWGKITVSGQFGLCMELVDEQQADG